MTEYKCILKGCDGTLHHYDGCLGYEAMVCDVCETHYTHNGVFVGDEYYEQRKLSNTIRKE